MGSLLKEATIEQSAAKIGLFGPGGSGKSLTATLIAIALSKVYHKGAPVVMQDTEGASDWLIPIYQAEGVKLHRVKSKAFVDLRQALREGEELGACAFISDSYSHPWGELQDSLKKRLNVKKLEFHHMQELQGLWQEWVDQFLNSPLHCLLAGRVANEWENDTDVETGKIGFHKVGTKMRSEKDAGYEPHMLIEMEAVRVMEELRETGSARKRKKVKVDRKAGGHFLHRLHVLKDRSRILNGRMIEFHDINDYQPGDWKLVYDALKPHFDNMNIGSVGNHAVDSKRTSAELFDDRGQSAYQQRGKAVTIALEEIEGTLVALWPGQDARSKQMKAAAIEALFNTRSWTAVESARLEALEFGLDVLRRFEKRHAAQAPDAILDKEKAVAFLEQLKAEPAPEEADQCAATGNYQQTTPKPLRMAHEGLDKIALAQRWAASEYAKLTGKKSAAIVITATSMGWIPEQFAALLRMHSIEPGAFGPQLADLFYEKLVLDLARGPEAVLVDSRILEAEAQTA